MRRSGKTTFLWQCLGDRLEKGAPRESLLYLSFEDERLVGMQASDLSWLVEEYFRQHPGVRDAQTATLFFDEIQALSGWEPFVRRLLDTEKVELFLSGSSARLLSREVASSMRGRALEVLIHPFSFRETLRHTGAEPEAPWDGLPKAVHSDLDHRLGAYLLEGGFPEAVGVPKRDHGALLQSYVDVVVLRDIIERHAVTNPVALRWMQRHLLASAAAPSAFRSSTTTCALKASRSARIPCTPIWAISKTLFSFAPSPSIQHRKGSGWSILAKPTLSILG
jgi:predicted AAA+ superfamily ATPase